MTQQTDLEPFESKELTLMPVSSNQMTDPKVSFKHHTVASQSAVCSSDLIKVHASCLLSPMNTEMVIS